jgi:hypothetical protein
MKVPLTIIVREKTPKEKHDDEVTATLIIWSVAFVVGITTLGVILINLFTPL